MDTLDTRLEAFRDYVADPTIDEARAVAARSWQPRRHGVQWRLLVPAAGVMFAGVLLALLVSRDEPRRAVPGTQPTPTVRTDVGPGLVVTPPQTTTSPSPGSGATSCGEIVVEPADGGSGLIYAIRDVRGMTCADAERITRLTATGRALPAGWHCDAGTCWQGGDLAEAFRRFTYVFGGDAG
ncbi:MAG TPA: hypothetical protein PLV41_02895 [Miltoncostaeales bacterium]|jgi:hypothetical protein|nr:hypothetical protein [Miltoncostaeales bacterium]